MALERFPPVRAVALQCEAICALPERFHSPQAWVLPVALVILGVVGYKTLLEAKSVSGLAITCLYVSSIHSSGSCVQYPTAQTHKYHLKILILWPGRCTQLRTQDPKNDMCFARADNFVEEYTDRYLFLYLDEESLYFALVVE